MRKKMNKRPTVAICYDFDGTLSPGYMQNYDYIPKLRLGTEAFWSKVKKRAKKEGADEILVYMNYMIKEANAADLSITKKDFIAYGKNVELFPGVKEWFKRIKKYGSSNGINIEHYLISSGIKEMILGTKIKRDFKEIYASTFLYNASGVAEWPALAINYTNKTQFLYRINKGALDPSDNEKINKYIPNEKRPVPFERIIYIGDGSTDVPCMSLVKNQGGYSIAVYKPHTSKSKKISKELLDHGRINYISTADYRAGKTLEKQVQAIINKIVADYRLNLLEKI